MAFVKTHWVDNSEPAITAAQLNRIEDGIEEAGESSKAIVLTQAEYDALSDAEKDSDNVYYISDAPFDLPNVVACTSAEYAAMSDATKMDGRLYYVTDEEEVAKSLVVQQNVNSPETVPSSAVVYKLNAAITPISFSIAANTSGTIGGYTGSNSDRRLLVFAHSTNAALTGIYLVLSASVVVPIIEATGLNITVASGTVTVENTTSNNCNGVVFT